jgi:drug/metabolite transporter superfamily protein YnfA
MDKNQMLSFLAYLVLYFLYKAIVGFIKGIWKSANWTRYIPRSGRKLFSRALPILLLFVVVNVVFHLAANPKDMFAYYSMVCFMLSFAWLWTIDEYDLSIKDIFSMVTFGIGCILLHLHPLF